VASAGLLKTIRIIATLCLRGDFGQLVTWVFILILLWLPLGSALADDAPISDVKEIAANAAKDSAEKAVDKNDDDTADVDTETTVDREVARRGLKIDGDLRPIFNAYDRDRRDGTSKSDEQLGFRARFLVDYGLTDSVHVGARLAGVCYVDDCNLEFVLDRTSSTNRGLRGGEFTFDELYLHWFRTERGSFAVGRLQTRAVLRSGVYAKSLDRNNSNNVNVNWTDGLLAIYRAANGWRSSFVLERNDSDGSSSIRHGPLDYNDSEARNTFFTGFENIERWGLIVQRAFDVSYLPASLLKDGDIDGRRVDYWGLVGRLAFRWPQRSEGIRIRSGAEIGYAPETPTAQAVNLEEDADGLAWDVVVSIMDFRPGHSIGVNYAQTGAGWLLSPQFRPNEELLELRYQWRSARFPLLEIRIRRREDLEQETTAIRKRHEIDGYIRLTWEFDLLNR
jgi:hypothetical protein